MKYLILISLFVIVASLNSSFGLPLPPPTNFVITLMDEYNNMIETPAFLQIEEILNGEKLQSYRLDLIENPESISMAWFVPNLEEDTEIHIAAVKQGFVTSDEFVFTITSDIPKEGTLFEHTFILKTEESSKISEKDFSVTSDGKSFNILTKTSSNIQSINFLESENTVLMIVNEDSVSGFTDLIIPTGLISPPFRVLLDNVGVFPSEKSNPDNTELHLEYPNGIHILQVISPMDSLIHSGEEIFESETEEKPVTAEEKPVTAEEKPFTAEAKEMDESIKIDTLPPANDNGEDFFSSLVKQIEAFFKSIFGSISR